MTPDTTKLPGIDAIPLATRQRVYDTFTAARGTLGSLHTITLELEHAVPRFQRRTFCPLGYLCYLQNTPSAYAGSPRHDLIATELDIDSEAAYQFTHRFDLRMLSLADLRIALGLPFEEPLP